MYVQFSPGPHRGTTLTFPPPSLALASHSAASSLNPPHIRDGTNLVPSLLYEQGQASAFAWKRDSGNAGADATWNAAHAGKKAISLSEADLNGDVKITCTLTGNGPGYGSIAVDEDTDATHTRGTLDANDTFQIVNGELKVTTSRGDVYALEDGKVKAAGAKLNGSITAESKLFASQPEDVVEFSYDHNGLRTQKKVTKADATVETTDYVLHGKLVTHLTRGSDEMHFFYDAQSRPAMVEFNGALYSYVHNLQGDIVGIVDSAGSLVVEYKYDAWGEPVLVRTLTTAYEALAELNPFRYRGYVFDGESNLQYLKGRYYSVMFGRFLNIDAILEYMRKNSINLFVYCKNNYINCVDSNGFSTVYINFYLKPLPDYGHTDITIDGVTCSFGRYGDVDEETKGLTGEGILVMDDYGKSLQEACEKGRTVFRFELEMTNEEVERLEEFYENKMNEALDKEIKSNKNGRVGYYKLPQSYHIKEHNCTTFALQALEYAYGEDKFNDGDGKWLLWTPLISYAAFRRIYERNDPFIKSLVTIEPDD